MPNYSDYIVFADESGDHGLVSINPQFPVFALAFCVVKVDDYINSVVPDMQRLKFSTWGHDSVIFHERDIRKSEKDFVPFRIDPVRRANFLDGLNSVMDKVRMNIIASVIDKNSLAREYETPSNPYEIALLLCMERLLRHLLDEGQLGKTVHIVFESRGKREDADLEAEFRKICAGQVGSDFRDMDFTEICFEPIFTRKSANSVGLQLADLVARPIALSVLRPNQDNRAYDIIRPKIWDLEIFP